MMENYKYFRAKRKNQQKACNIVNKKCNKLNEELTLEQNTSTLYSKKIKQIKKKCFKYVNKEKLCNN